MNAKVLSVALTPQLRASRRLVHSIVRQTNLVLC